MTRLNISLFVALAASLLAAVPVDAHDTLPHQRMIRKRGPPAVGGPGPIGAAAVIGLRVRQATADPTGSASQSASSAPASTTAAASSSREATSTAVSSSAAAPTTTSVALSSTAAATTTSPTTSSASSTTPASTSSGGLLDSLTGILASSTSSISSSASSTPATTATPTSTSTTQAAATPTPTTTQQQQPAAEESPTLNIATPSPSATARSPSVSVNVITSTQALAEASASAVAAKEKTKKITRNTIVSLVVVASCIGGAIAIWTVIRKWKLSPSEKFDDRMQPIDWAPPANGAGEDVIEEKTKHRRGGSGASHGSFTSGGVGQSEQGHGPKYAESQHGYGPQSQDIPPPHDFTAGATQPGAYGQYYAGQQRAGGPGYADLQRGPSLSESNYSHGANVSRGMSYSRGHGAYDSQSGAVPHLPNPYGGEYNYDEYNHPQAGQQPPVQVQAQGQAPYRPF